MAEVCGRIHSLESFGAVDGPGIRCVLFLQGCPLRCLYCHNPDTWNSAGGREVAASEIVSEIAGYRNFIRSGGVTLSGGEPLLQASFAREVLRLCHREGFHTALDTAGSVALSAAEPVLAETDLVLLDIKAADPALCRELTGNDGANARALLRFCENVGKPVWIRHVLLPGVTLLPERLEALADFLTGFSCIRRVELLAFHKMGEYKWRELGLEYRLASTPPPSPEEVEAARALLLARKLPLNECIQSAVKMDDSLDCRD